MPVTRSQSGREGRRQQPEAAASDPPAPQQSAVIATPSARASVQQQSSAETSASSEVIASSGTGTTMATSSGTATTTGVTTTTDATATATTETSQKSSENEAATKKSEARDAAIVSPTRATEGAQIAEVRSHKSTLRRSTSSKKSTKALRLAKAKEELLRLQVELATARITAIEEEVETEDEEDADTVTTQHETTRRVAEWLNDSQPQLAIAEEPYNQQQSPAQEEPIGQNITVQAQVHSEVPRMSAPQPEPRLLSAHPPRAPACIGIAQSALPSASHAPRIAHENAPPSPSQGAAAIAVRNTQQSVDLSELAKAIALAARSGLGPRHIQELPLYFGSYQEWLSFRAAYTESENCYSETENIARLRRSLRGRAKEAVETLLLYQAKPAEVMKTLESRFGRPDAIAIAETERLRSLARPTDAPRDICIFATKVYNIVATLRALGKVYYMYNPEVTKAIIEKLTPTMRYRWFDYACETPSEEADLVRLSNFLQREAERCGPYAQPETSTTDSTSKPQPQRRDKPQKSYNTVDKQASDKPINRNCVVCDKGGHAAFECKQFIEADAPKRWEIAKTKRLCFRCLRYRNRSHSCPKTSCSSNGCEKTHHKMLHFERTEDNEDSKEIVASTWTSKRSCAQAFLKIIPVTVSGPRGTVQTHAILDDGSTVTLIDRELAEQTGARGPVDPLHIEAVAKNEVHISKSRRVLINLQGTSGNNVNIHARTFDDLRLSAQQVSYSNIEGCKHLNDIAEHLTYERAIPRLLIGQDNYHLLLSSETRKGQRDQPVASRTPLGWVLHGASTRTLGQRVNFVHHVTESEAGIATGGSTATSDESINEQLRHHFALESLVIAPKQPHSDPEHQALKILEKNTTQLEDGRYQTGLLWKKESITMPNNFENAYRRLMSTEKKIDKDPLLKQKYEEQMTALIERGYAERAPPKPANNERVWYLPHFAVINPMKPGKVRVVHDAAAKTRGISLNDCLLTGPDLLQSLPGVLMRFRQHPVAVSSDIAEMFMQVKIQPEDRDALRYLWRGKQRGDQQPEEFRMTSLIFGATSSPATAIYVKNINAKKYEHSNPEAYKAIVHNHYVDDYLQSFPDEEAAIRTAGDVRSIHREAQYELRQWTSNSRNVLQALGETTDETALQSPVGLQDGAKTERVLGLLWQPNTDVLTFNLDLARLPQNIINSNRPTKREMLKIIMSLFDPLGFAAPVTSRAKQILQETWRRGTGWDEKLDDDTAKQWQDWMGHLRALRGVAIPRCLQGYTDAHRRELHTFVDASESAYAAVLYWRTLNSDGQVSLSLVLGKSRVCPLTVTSIPRLELQAAVMGVRMATAVIEEHDVQPDAKYFWTDSKTVLAWIRNGSRSYRPFVAHRIAAIEESSTVSEWRWLPTKLNVADDATRDVPSDLDSHHRWFTGPEFLRKDVSSWPADVPVLTDKTGEEKTCTVSRKKSPLTDCVPDVYRFSRWERLLRATARILQFIKLVKQRTSKKEAVYYKRTKKNAEKDPTWRKQATKKIVTQKTTHRAIEQKRRYLQIDGQTLHEAENILIRVCQADAFGEEIAALTQGKIVDNGSRLRPLATEIVNGVITLKSRIDAARDIEESVKRPPVLDGNHHITRLYIDFMHRRLHHSGVEATVNECRQYYWVLRLRPTAKMVIHGCLPCRIRRNKPSTPPTGNHPASRLAFNKRAFSFTGLDYFGPLQVTIGRATQKRYVALFTCLTTRAVHLEVAASLSADSAVLALRRMIARRGCPVEIWSDNGTNLQGAARELREAADTAAAEEASRRGVSWRHITPAAPFMGGAWERLVRSVKTALYTVLHERHPSEETLHTLLAEVEFTVNSRPLTHVSVSPEDPEALTPNHFLLGGSAQLPPIYTSSDSDLVGREHWRASQRLADLFWTRWLREYLPKLQNRREPHGKGPAIIIGDVVLIADGNLPRNTWPRGLVIATYPGPDGVIRTVDVRTKGGVLRRPTKKLVILPTKPVVAHEE